MLDFPSPVFYAEDPSLFPTVAHPGEDVGFDLKAADSYVVPGSPVLIDTGVKVWLPPVTSEGIARSHFMLELQIRSRSGLAKKGIVVVNQPSTIDPGYKGNLMVMVRNLNHNRYDPFQVNKGDRIAQAIINLVVNPEYVNTCTDIFKFQQLQSVYRERGEGGFGSSGIN